MEDLGASAEEAILWSARNGLEDYEDEICPTDTRDSGISASGILAAGMDAAGVEGAGSEGLAPWLKLLREKARQSELRPSQSYAFLAAVELDESRPQSRRVGYRALFEEYCEHGKAHWLNPVRALKPLNDSLERFHGAATGLRFIIIQALALARAGISPDAFIRHVVVPRMFGDADWRGWRARHSLVISCIAELLIGLRKKFPYDALHLGQTDVLSDVALSKYVGRPLCRLSAEQWTSLEPKLEAYGRSWLDLSFSSRRYLLFLRQNILPFLYRLSGLIDPQQLGPIIEEAAALEAPFCARIEALKPEIAERILQNARLYRDVEQAISSGRDAGASWLSFARQLRGYLRLVAALVSANAGLTLLSHTAALLKRTQDPDFPETCARLIGFVRDSGGTAALSWHIERLWASDPIGRQALLEELRVSGGLALDYPYRDILLPYDAEEKDRIETAVRLAGQLGIMERARAIMAGQKRKELSLAIALEAYSSTSPQRKAACELFMEGASRGMEREWTEDQIAAFDQDGSPGHELLMRRFIKGLGSGFSAMALKTGNLAGLKKIYGAVDRMSFSRIDREFSLAEGSDAAESRLSSLTRDELRKRIGLDFIGRVITAFIEFDPEAKDAESCEAEAFAALGRLQRDVRRGLEPIQDRLAKLEAELGELRSLGKVEEAAALEKKNAKLRQQGSAAAKRLSIFDRLFLIKNNEERKIGQRYAAALHACAFVCKPADDTARAFMLWTLKRYSARPGLRERFAFIKADVSPDFVGLEQLSYLIDCLDALCLCVSQDPELLCAIDESMDEELSSFLTETSQLAGRRPQAEGFDAALRRLSGASRLEAERTKWKEMVDGSGTAQRDARPYAVRLSKCFMDSYFGDFGGVCLSNMPDLILRPGFYPIRLIDSREKQAAGSALVAYCVNTRSSFGAQRYWLAFAFNPLRSISRKWNARQMLIVYLAWRRILEQLSQSSGLPVLLSGVGSNGLLSNNLPFQSLIVNYERRWSPLEVHDARGFSAIYPKEQFSRALLIIQPQKPETLRAESELASLLAGELGTA